jgi:hypothetical protein
MTVGAADARKPGFTESDRRFHVAIPRYHTPRDGQGCLKYARRRDVRAREFIHHAIPIRVGSHPESLRALHAVVVVIGVIGELSNGNHTAGLMERPD